MTTTKTHSTKKGIIRSDHFMSPATGRCYWINRDGKAEVISYEDYLDALDFTNDPCEDEYIHDEDGSEAFARMLERRAESGTWFGFGRDGEHK